MHYGVTQDSELPQVVEAMGGRLEYGQSPLGSRCSIEIPANYPDQPFVIHLDPFPAPEVDRLGIAHELGHLMLHYLTPRIRSNRSFALRADFRVQTQSKDEVIAEIEADWFAYAFLVSDEDIKQALSEAGNDIGDATTKLMTNCRVPEIVASARIKRKGN